MNKKNNSVLFRLHKIKLNFVKKKVNIYNYHYEMQTIEFQMK